MYSYCDQNVFGMPRGERLLLCGTRAWALAVDRGTCPLRLLLPVFCHMGLVTSTIHFHKSMCCLTMGGMEPASLVNARGDGIDEMEAVLLALWKRLRGGEQEVAIRTLEHLVEPGYVPQALDAMTATVRDMLARRPGLFHDDPVKAFPRSFL